MVCGSIVLDVVYIKCSDDPQHLSFPINIMPSIKVIRAAIADLPKGPPLVVAISGGTTGIGAYIAKGFATTFAADGSRLRVYIIGRNATRAESVILEGKTIAPGSEWKFIKATDLSLMSEVDRCCADILKSENDMPFAGGPARLDLLYMTHSAPTMQAAALKRMTI
jgi:NAD(P)-dependent dehydrogenase (short-subunit alcohol dehydrogenase family)